MKTASGTAILGAALAAFLAVQPARAQETLDLFSGEAAETLRSAPNTPIPGVAPEAMGPVSFFNLSPAARGSLRTGSPVPRRIRIALPEGQGVTCTFPAQPDAVDPDGPQVLAGEVAGGDVTDHCTLVPDETGGVVGHVETASGRYRIVPVGTGGSHAVVRIVQSGFKRELEPLRRPRAALPQRDRQAAPGSCDRRMNASLPPRSFGPIRILILYTPAAKAMSNNIDADIALLMADMRKAFGAASTGGNFSVMAELAHSRQVDLVESAGGSMENDLERLSDPNDPLFRIVPDLKRKHRADLVHLLTASRPEDGCGIAWMNGSVRPSDRSWGFGVSDLNCALGGYTFVHETGHNLGMEHDAHVAARDENPGFNFGYVLPQHGVRSIMAYNNQCAEQNTDCRRLPAFSSPRLKVRGSPFGIESGVRHAAYNVEVLCRAAPVVAGFRNPFDFASYESHDVTGTEIGRHKDVTLQACASMCQDNKSCRAYSFDKWNRWCFLKGTVTDLRIEPKAVSGVRPEFGEPPRSSVAVEIVRYRGKHFPGRGYQTHRAASLDACESICRQDGHCMGFTHYRSENRCEAFASLGEYFSHSDADSGAKTQRVARSD